MIKTATRGVGLNRLEKLGRYLLTNRKGGHVKFDFATYHKNGTSPKGTCGTRGCALGEGMVLWPQVFKPNRDRNKQLRIGGCLHASLGAQRFFNLNPEEQSHLFMPEEQNEAWTKSTDVYWSLDDHATAKQVGRNILHFVKLKRAGKIE